MDLESILSSGCRRKMLKFLLENGSCNIMRLIVGVNSKYSQVNFELEILQKEGIIIDKHVGRMRIISLNRENPKTGVLLQALKLLHSMDHKP